MTIKQYSEIQRLLGRLEAFTPVIPVNTGNWYQSSLHKLSKIIEEMREAENGTEHRH